MRHINYDLNQSEPYSSIFPTAGAAEYHSLFEDVDAPENNTDFARAIRFNHWINVIETLPIYNGSGPSVHLISVTILQEGSSLLDGTTAIFINRRTHPLTVYENAYEVSEMIIYETFTRHEILYNLTHPYERFPYDRHISRFIHGNSLIIMAITIVQIVEI